MSGQQSQFWSSVADKYDRVVDLQIGFNARAMVRERLMREPRLGNAVEFGCGTGYFTQAIAQKAVSVLATDVAPRMLTIARARVASSNVRFQVEDCQRTSLTDTSFDASFLGLVLHFTRADETLAEMQRILRVGGMLIVANVDPDALATFNRIRAYCRIIYYGVVGYRIKPPKDFSRSLSGPQLAELLRASGFSIVSAEMIRDLSRPSGVPVEYVKAIKV